MTSLSIFICLRLVTAAFNLRYNLLCQPSRQIWSEDELKVRPEKQPKHILRQFSIQDYPVINHLPYLIHYFQLANGVWWFYFSKCLEFMDTMFFILRKKKKQLSFLHIYHHSTVFFIMWIAVKFVPTGSSEFRVECKCANYTYVNVYFFVNSFLTSLG